MPVNEANLTALRAALNAHEPGGDFAPAVYVVEPTSRCNLNCIMCPNSKLAAHQLGDFDLQEFTLVMQRIAPYAELVMLYFMGESTLHPQFARVLEVARREIRGRLVLSTNAADLSESTIDAMVENLDMVLVPIDRWDPEVYRRVRRGGDLAQVVRNTEAILARRDARATPRVVVKALDIHLPREGGEPEGEEAHSFRSYWEPRGAVPLFGWLNTWAGQMPNLLRLSSQDTPYTTVDREPCADLWFKMVINWQGNVVLCCHNWDYSIKIGDARAGDIRDVWNSEPIVTLRRSHSVGDFSCTAICATCREWEEASELDAYLRLDQDDLFKVF